MPKFIPEPSTHRAFASLSSNDKELLIAQRNEEQARLAIEGAMQALRAALVTQGKLVEAKDAGAEGVDDLVTAIEKPDDEICECEERIWISDIEKTKGRAEPVGHWHYPQYDNLYRAWSDTHNALVTFKRCRHCGDYQAFPEP